MTTKILYRTTSVDSKTAKAEILAAWPKSEITGIEIVKATERTAKIARTTVGDLIYEATVKFAEFPDESGESDGPPPPPPPPPAEESEEDKPEETEEAPEADESESEDKPEGEGDSADDGPSHKPKELSPDEKIIHLLTQLLDLAQTALGPPPDELGLGGPDDLGEAGPLDGPPPPPAGPGGPGGPPDGPALPPPARPAGPGGPAFSHYDPTVREFALVRKKAGEIGTRALVVETELLYPTHRVAKINRNGEAMIDGLSVNLAKSNIALIQLVAK